MWNRNALTERLGIEWPILQAPMGGAATPALAAAVSSAGGLGALGMWGLSADDARRGIDTFRQQCAGPLNVNYPLWPHAGDLAGTGMEMRARLQSLYDEQGLGPLPEPRSSAGGVDDDHLALLLATRPAVVSFHFGLPGAGIVRRLRDAGVFVVSSATTVDEARALEAGGVDAVIAQGIEAGGHRGTFSAVGSAQQPGLFALLPQVVDAVRVPVIAAGGIADGRGIAAALVLGASAVQIGTAFLGCEETAVSDVHRAALRTAGDSATMVTDVVSGRPARFLRNRLVDTLHGLAPLPFPAQYGLVAPLAARGDPGMTPLYAGQSAALTREMPAADLVRTLAAETASALGGFA